MRHEEFNDTEKIRCNLYRKNGAKTRRTEGMMIDGIRCSCYRLASDYYSNTAIGALAVDTIRR